MNKQEWCSWLKTLSLEDLNKLKEQQYYESERDNIQWYIDHINEEIKRRT